MSGNSKAMPFHGILAMGNTKDEAVNRYRLLALGKGVSAMRDTGGKVAFVTHASNKIAEMFNPQSGELDLSRDDSILSKLQFEAKAGEIEANHYVCESGCGLHMVYDSESLVKHCPSCTTAIASDEDEDEDEYEESDDDQEDEDSEDEENDEDYDSESSDDDEEEEEDEVVEDAEDDADEEVDDGEEDTEEDIEGGSDEEIEDEDESEDDESEDDAEEEDSDDEEEEEDDSGEPLVIAADSKEKAIDIYRQNRTGIATAATTVEVDYVQCSSQECNAHIISEDPTLTQCPACQSYVKQPEAVSSEDDEDEEDEEDTDLEVIPDDEDDEEEDTSESNTQPDTGNNMNVENVTVDVLTQLNDTAEDAHKGLDVSFSSSVAGAPMWTAYFNGLPVATASKTDAGKNADIFENPAFGQAVIAGARHVGVKTTLTEMGFKGIAHEISISSVVTDKVNSQVAEAKAGLDRDRQEHAERLMAALATAAIGINRGFFQDTNNPVKAALWNAMSSAGVKNAEVLIDNAFRTSNDEYHRTLFAKASELIAQPLEVQESLSKAVLGTNYMNAPTATASDNKPGVNFEDRLELGRSTATASDKEEEAKPNQESTSSDANARISRTIAGLGRRRS